MIAVSDVCPYFINPRSPISKSIGIAGSKLEGKSSVLKKTIKYMYITKGCPIFSVNLLANPFYKIYPSRPTKGKKKNNWEEKVAHAKEETQKSTNHTYDLNPSIAWD